MLTGHRPAPRRTIEGTRQLHSGCTGTCFDGEKEFDTGRIATYLFQYLLFVNIPFLFFHHTHTHTTSGNILAERNHDRGKMLLIAKQMLFWHKIPR